jgi:pimeloyl-ACP methyl ester carboxylesterase
MAENNDTVEPRAPRAGEPAPEPPAASATERDLTRTRTTPSAPLAQETTRRRLLGRLAGGGAALLLASGVSRRSAAGAGRQNDTTPVAGTPGAATPVAPGPAFVLVHGTFFGGSGWGRVPSLLEQAGHRVFAPDLPAHGEDRTPIPEVSLQSYVDRVLAILDEESSPVVLVGHSMGGIVISEVAERRPDKVGILVYLAAYLLADGQSLFDVGSTDADSQVAPRLAIDEANGVMTLSEEDFAETFLHDVPAADAARALAQLRPEPLAPLATPIRTTAANFGRVRRVYVETLADRSVSPGLQRRMYGAIPCERILSLETGHCPFLADPDALVAHLRSV